MVIFQNYSSDLDAVQKIYEAQARTGASATTVAGDIMWAGNCSGSRSPCASSRRTKPSCEARRANAW